jgi:hypothetical protein
MRAGRKFDFKDGLIVKGINHPEKRFRTIMAGAGAPGAADFLPRQICSKIESFLHLPA